MQLIMTLVVGGGLLFFLGLIILMSIAITIDTLQNGLGSESQRRERDRMMGDPKDRP